MRTTRFLVAALLLAAPAAGAQQPDSAARARARADSVAKAVRDSIALMKELGAAVADTTTRPATPAVPQGGPTNPRLLPDISAVGDFIGDLSPKGSTQEDGTRFGVREVELAVQAVVDPYFRGDVFLGISDPEGIAIEQAFLTTTSPPQPDRGRGSGGSSCRSASRTPPTGTTCTPSNTRTSSSASSATRGSRGPAYTGAGCSRPSGSIRKSWPRWWTASASRRTSSPSEPVNKSLGGLGYLGAAAQLRGPHRGAERRAVVLGDDREARAAAGAPCTRTLFAGVDATRGAAVDLRRRSHVPVAPAPAGDLPVVHPAGRGDAPAQRARSRRAAGHGRAVPAVFGGPCLPTRRPMPDQRATSPARTLFARYQTGQRSFLGARYDWLQDPERDGRTLNAGSVYLEWFPSEFSKLVAGYEAAKPQDATLAAIASCCRRRSRSARTSRIRSDAPLGTLMESN